MSITSDEINFLLYRYLQESGFSHSAFSFGNESLITRTTICGEKIPAGALISLLQKGLQYLEIEAHLREDGTEIECDQPFRLLEPHTCGVRKDKASSQAKGGSSMDVESEVANPVFEIHGDEVTTLRGHEQEVYVVSFNPVSSLLASGGGDSTARIWKIPAGPSGSNSDSRVVNSVVLRHPKLPDHQENSITAMAWAPDGNCLATGAYDGVARVWDTEGNVVHELKKHDMPVFCLAYNPFKKNQLITGSVDHTAVLWDVETGKEIRTFEFHSEPVFDIAWRNEKEFATCSTDHSVVVCSTDLTKPMRVFVGHKGDVNSVRWNAEGNRLASCSDDKTCKIWSLESDQPMLELSHDREVYMLRWSPTGPGTASPERKLVLATASFDATVRIWDPETGNCIAKLTEHTAPVYTIAFSPSGEFLATGAYDRCIYVYLVKDATLVMKYHNPNEAARVSEVCWNREGDKIAACYANNRVSVMDFEISRFQKINV